MIHKLGNSRELQLSERLVYKALIQFGELTTSDLVGYTGGSQSSVYRILCSLVDEDLVLQSTGGARSGNGRRPISYRINPDAMYVVGAFLRWDVFGIGLCTVDGRIVDKAQQALTHGVTPTDVVSFMSSAVTRILAERQISTDKVLGLGLATTGPLLKDKGILYHPYHIDFPSWDVVPIRDMLEMSIPLSVSVNNLATAALHGELMTRRTGLTERCSYILMDEGIGTETYVPGAADRTLDDQSGAFGNLVIDFDRSPGTLSSYTSIEAVYRQFREAFPGSLPENPEPFGDAQRDLWRDDPRLRAVQDLILGLTDSERPRAEAVLSRIVQVFAAGIGSFVGLLNPRAVYYGGRVIEQFPDVAQEAVRLAVSRRPPEYVSSVEYVRSNLNDELLIRGAVYQVLDDRLGLFKPVNA